MIGYGAGNPVRRIQMIKEGEGGYSIYAGGAAGLVLLMTPELALFYGGMVRGKNVLGTIMQCFL